MLNQQEKHTKTLKKCRVVGPCAINFAAANTGSWRLERPVVRLNECIKCGTCQLFCPADLITVDREKERCVVIDLNYCKGCGICANECPKHCIDMVDERRAK